MRCRGTIKLASADIDSKPAPAAMAGRELNPHFCLPERTVNTQRYRGHCTTNPNKAPFLGEIPPNYLQICIVLSHCFDPAKMGNFITARTGSLDKKKPLVKTCNWFASLRLPILMMLPASNLQTSVIIQEPFGFISNQWELYIYLVGVYTDFFQE